MPSSIETGIQTALQAIIQGIGLAGIPNTQVRVRETPKVNEVLDKVPCVLICPRGPNKSSGAGFEGPVQRAYIDEVIVIDGREGDNSTDTPTTQLWHEQCVNAVERLASGQYRTGLAGVPTVFDIRVGDIPTFDRTKLSENYAYLSFFVTVSSSE